jgi:hypothetical protein
MTVLAQFGADLGISHDIGRARIRKMRKTDRNRYAQAAALERRWMRLVRRC